MPYADKEKERQNQKEKYRRRMARLAADPVAKQAYQDKKKEIRRRYYDKHKGVKKFGKYHYPIPPKGTPEYEAYREKRRESNRRWKEKNPLLGGKRRYPNRQPAWLSEEEIRVMKSFYQMSRRVSKCLGIKHHVDHIVPLKGKNVSGLHVPWNLAVIPASLNLMKHNKVPKEV